MTAAGAKDLTAVEAGLKLAVVTAGTERVLQVRGPDGASLARFDGSASEGDGGSVLTGPLSPANAAAVRALVPNLNPVPIGLATSAGTGDRLGLATPGHVRAFQKYGAGLVPFFAQQSAREMERLGRTPQEVFDAATFGALQAGWTGPVGSDCDHLKSTADIDGGIAAGFTMFTLDPGDAVVEVESLPTSEQLAAVPWAELEDDLDSMLARYESLGVDLGGRELRISPDEVRHVVVKYGPCVALAVRLYRHLEAHIDRPHEVEIAIDETDYVTTLPEHAWFANELQRLGVAFVSFAPRYEGTFEKGVEFIGSIDDLRANLEGHAAIARVFGPYKISLHSGSDKFSIYPMAAAATDRIVHLKTSGTSWLCALEVAAAHAPDLCREIYDVAREAYRGARATYHVSAVLDRTPDPAVVSDADLPGLVAAHDTRQLLHVGYGAALRESPRAPVILAALRDLLVVRQDEYAQVLQEHIGRHIAPFALA